MNSARFRSGLEPCPATPKDWCSRRKEHPVSESSGCSTARCALIGLAAALAFLALGSPPAYATIYPDNDHARAQVEVYYPGWSWRGAKAHVEVRSGSVGQTDADNNGWVVQPLWVANRAQYGLDRWVEVGVIRHIWTPFNNLLVTRFYWYNVNSSGGHWHVISWHHLDPNDYLGTRIEFRISNVQDTSNWTVTIDGQYADDEDNDHTASPGFNKNDWYAVGVESCASSGRYATKSDHCEVNQIMRNYDWSSWNYAGVQYAQDLFWNDPNGLDGDPSAHGGWTTRVQSMWDYRNDPN